MKLKSAIELMQANAAELTPALLERDVESFVIDSREVKAGDVFFALSQPEYKNNGFNGEFADATVFVPGALNAGAVAAIVRRDRYEEHVAELEPFRDRIAMADDAIAALQRLAHGVFSEWNRPVVAITGSAGKTTAKEITAHVLGHGGRHVLRNIKNYNNGLGHPLTVLNLVADPSYDVAVLEMGMSTPLNEIARLCRITPPDVSVVLNVLSVHIEHLGTIERIAQAKAEIVEGMKPGGTAVLNADDERVAAMSSLSKGKVVTYGIDADADLKASDIRFIRFGETAFKLRTPAGETEVNFPLNGRHNILNALAAAAVGHSFGMGPAEIAERLATAPAPAQRGEVLEFADGFTVINDSYNSNPAALLSMVRTLVDGAVGASRTIVVAGEMLELGPESELRHTETGKAIAEAGVDILIGVRGDANRLVEGAGSAGIGSSVFAKDSAAAAELLAREIRPGDAVLVKGSRGVKTEVVIEKLVEKFELRRRDGRTVATGQ